MKHFKFKKELYKLRKNNLNLKIILKKQKLIIDKLLLKLEKTVNKNTQNLEFISHLSHELKTPLNAIWGFASLLLETELPREKQIQYCKNIISASKHLLHLSEYTIDMARAETNNFDLYYSEFSVDECVLEIVDILAQQITKKHLNVITNLNAQYIVADKRRFKQLVYNLLGNAIKFNKLGGFVKIETKVEDNKFYFIIKDSGVGIAKESQDKIFNFFTNIPHDNLDGEDSHGIGLYLCKKIVDLHNGEIHFISTEDIGTKFWFVLPIDGLEVNQ